jgi:NADH dehydrogenase FAD-containing subunit
VTEFIKLADTNGDGKVDEAEFIKFALEHQQQASLGDWKKLTHSKILPFRYKHLGGFEYVGYEHRITNRGSQGRSIIDGFGAWWLWRSIYLSRMVGWRNRFQIAFDFAVSKISGPDFGQP